MIDQLRQAAQQALDAIHLYLWAGDKHLLQDAHEALRTVLLQPPLPVQEPVALAQRILELEALLERQTARIVDLQTHIENFDGED